MSAFGQLRKIRLQLDTLKTGIVGSQLKGNLVTASAAPSVNVPSARVERPPSPPALGMDPAVPRAKDRTGRISSVLPTRYSPTATIPSFSLGSPERLENMGKYLKTKFFSDTPTTEAIPFGLI
jgi:hypothetical protein